MGATESGRSREQAASSWARKAVLVGWAANGVVYLALGWLVLQLAVGTTPQQASTGGALEYLAGTVPGSVAMVVLGIGLLAYAIGRILEVTVLATPAIEATHRLQAAVLALVYTSLAISAFSIVGLVSRGSSGGGGAGASGSDPSAQQGAAILLDLPAGRWLVLVVGVAVAALGIYTVYRAIDKQFLGTLRTGEMSAAVRTWSTRLGVAAYATKGVVFVLVGWFLVQAAITYDASAARGLDGTLRAVAGAAWGKALLIAIAVGLAAYGLFCEVEARYRRVGVSATGMA